MIAARFRLVCFLPFLCCGICAITALASADSQPGNPDRYNVVWNQTGSASDSMPMGNGDLAANVWVDGTGDLLLLIAKTDSCSENSELLKLGRVRVHFPDHPLGGNGFSQELRLRQGDIVIHTGSGADAISLTVWIDANRPELHVETDCGTPVDCQATLELWRNERVTLDAANRKNARDRGFFELAGGPTIVMDPDTVLPATNDRLTWCHRNSRSIYPSVLKVQHLDTLVDKYPDPLLNRTFGCVMRGPNWVARDDHILHTAKPAAKQRLDITALTEIAPTLDQWHTDLSKLTDTDDAAFSSAKAASEQWWGDFWQRSWIDVDGSPQAREVASGYALQRFQQACQGRGNLPMKFNGGLFSVGHVYADPNNPSKKIEDPDFRRWGSCYWFQNERHEYWPMIAAGDFDTMEAWFDMYVRDLPLARDRVAKYYHHGGACFQETTFFFGLPNNSDFGWTNPDNEMVSHYMRWYWSGGLEMTAMMLARYQYIGDDDFARKTLLPFASEILTFYDEHWKRDEKGLIRFEPAQSLETYQTGVVNPLPEIAGLRYVLPQMLDLPENLTTPPQRDQWKKLLSQIPPIPIGPWGKSGTVGFLPAEKFGGRSNSENTELYCIHPYRLYGVGQPDLQLARDSYAHRLFKGPRCWSQDPMDAALLGLADDAKEFVHSNFTDTGARFQAFWSPGHDWIPDLDNGGAGMQALQWMLLKCDGKTIRLLPAWPKEWTADFKLHAPGQTIVQASVREGKIVDLKVTPESRAKDVVLSQ